jgi:hypothetical protein
MSLTTLNPAIVIAIVAVILAIGVALWMYVKYAQKKRTQELRSKFGPEYDKAIERTSISPTRGIGTSETREARRQV